MVVDGDDEPADVSDRPGCLTRYLWAILLGTAVGVLGLAAVIRADLELFTSASEAPDDAATGAAGTDDDATEPDGATDDTAEPDGGAVGPLSGTWAMYWTNSLGNENQAFTITFTGDTTGTLEILNDETEVDTAFQVQDDLVTFEFTRMFSFENSPWPNASTFEGRFTGPDEIEGMWAREGGECVPGAGCSTGEWEQFNAWLVRTSE